MPPRRRSSAGGAVVIERAADGGGPALGSGGGGAGDGPALRHCFLQAIMARQYVQESEAKQLYRQITGATNDANYFNFVAEINQHLSFALFELRRAKFPGDGEFYLGFVNLEADEPSKRSTKYRGKDGKPDTRVSAYFRALLDNIVAAAAPATQGTAPQMSFLTQQQALYAQVLSPDAATQEADEGAATTAQQQADEARKLSLRERETTLAQLTTDGWLAHMPGRANCYTLGPRAYLELSQALEGTAP